MARRATGRAWRVAAVAVCLLWAAAAPARAQTVSEERLWFLLLLQEPGVPTSPWRWTAEVILRSRDGASGLDVLSVRPTIIYALHRHSSVGGGYGFASSFPASGGSVIEHRAFGQYLWTGRTGAGVLSLRTRAEARLVEGNSGVAGRLREQVRYTQPLRAGSPWSAAVATELFMHVNETARYARGVDQVRFFAGVTGPVSGALRLEAGYLQQFSPGHHGAAARRNHVVATTATVIF